MDRKTFTFSCVVNVEKIGKIFKIFKEGKYNFTNVQYFTCYVDQEYNDAGTRHLKGMVQFDDNKRWFYSAIGNMLSWCLFALQGTDVIEHYIDVIEQRSEVENGQTFEYGEFVFR